ncbi:MAG: lysozyme inhibitor LprI family protein [Leptolyngbyaceae cyanobacterium]
MDKLSKNQQRQTSLMVLPLMLLLLLVSCGRSNTPEDAPDTAETTEAAPETDPETDVEQPAAETTPETPRSEPADTAEETTRPAPVALTKQDCGQMATQLEMNQCAAENYSISDKALNQIYQDVRQSLNDTAKAQLTTAEERWIVFRDAQCTFESDRYEGGSIAPLIQASCMEQITDNRIAALEQSDQTQLSYADADAQLNDVYQQIQALLDESRAETLTDVQLSWLDYRDAHCDYEASLPAGPARNTCLAELTETRVWQLEALQDELSL